MKILSAAAEQKIELALNYAADLASPVAPKDWIAATKRFCLFVIVASVAVGLNHLTGSIVPVFMIGWAWGMLGMYGMMRKR